MFSYLKHIVAALQEVLLYLIRTYIFCIPVSTAVVADFCNLMCNTELTSFRCCLGLVSG